MPNLTGWYLLPLIVTDQSTPESFHLEQISHSKFSTQFLSIIILLKYFLNAFFSLHVLCHYLDRTFAYGTGSLMAAHLVCSRKLNRNTHRTRYKLISWWKHRDQRLMGTLAYISPSSNGFVFTNSVFTVTLSKRAT